MMSQGDIHAYNAVMEGLWRSAANRKHDIRPKKPGRKDGGKQLKLNAAHGKKAESRFLRRCREREVRRVGYWIARRGKKL